jgi:hypothetical protein
LYTTSLCSFVTQLFSTPLTFIAHHHRLNSTPEALLRKSNKSKLTEIKNEWERLNPAQKKQKKKLTTASFDHDSTVALESILVRVLQPHSSTVQRVIAATLHESSSDELPCWDEDLVVAAADESPSSTGVESTSLQICLLLGAVRDMHPTENRCLRRVCDANALPLLRIRVGPVPEFTSKILTVLAFHHAHGRLGPACRTLLFRKLAPTTLTATTTTGVDAKATASVVARAIAAPPPPLLLHFVCFVSLSSVRFSARFEDRSNNRVLWCMYCHEPVAVSGGRGRKV